MNTVLFYCISVVWKRFWENSIHDLTLEPFQNNITNSNHLIFVIKEFFQSSETSVHNIMVFKTGFTYWIMFYILKTLLQCFSRFMKDKAGVSDSLFFYFCHLKTVLRILSSRLNISVAWKRYWQVWVTELMVPIRSWSILMYLATHAML